MYSGSQVRTKEILILSHGLLEASASAAPVSFAHQSATCHIGVGGIRKHARLLGHLNVNVCICLKTYAYTSVHIHIRAYPQI